MCHRGLVRSTPARTPFVAVLALLLMAAIPAMADDDPRQALVHVFVKASHPDPLAPWTHVRAQSFTGSGVILDGERILTNAHVVKDAVHIEVQREGTPNRVQARVLFANEDCDLALLTTDDPAFFDGVEPIGIGELPEPQDEVAVLGYPVGGDSLSITSGIVSRREFTPCGRSADQFLMVQIDAPINDGNSGGPVLRGSRLVGIATHSYLHAERTNFMVPTPIIEHFLEDVEDGAVDGLPSLDVPFQTLTHPALRRAVGLDEQQTGVRLTGDGGDYVYNEFLPGDVLLELDGQVIEEDGLVTLDDGLRVSFEQALHRHQTGELVDAEVLRDGEVRTLELRVRTTYFDGDDERGDYLIVGGLLLQPLTSEFLAAVEDEVDADLARLLQRRADDARSELDRWGLVIISRVLSHDVNRGYDWATWAILDTLNGEPADSLEYMASILATNEAEMIEITTTCGELIVLDREQAGAATEELLETYGVPADRARRLREYAGSP